MINLFNKNKTKWQILANYEYASVDYIVFTRADKKTGLLDFKVKRVHKNAMWTKSVLPFNLIDIKEQWDKILLELK